MQTFRNTFHTLTTTGAEKLTGLFVRSIVDGSDVHKRGVIRVNDQIIKVLICANKEHSAYEFACEIDLLPL